MRSAFCALFIFAALVFGPTDAEAGFDWGDWCDGGNGSFSMQTEQQAAVVVGEIPAGLSGVEIKLLSTNDVDIQLYDKETNTAIVAWPDGILNLPNEHITDYVGVTIEYSGYNGDQTPTGKGNEYIKILDTTNRPLIMKAFGYTAGSAVVNYTWTGRGETVRIAELDAQLAQVTGERDARPTAEQLATIEGERDAAIAERDARYTEDQVRAMSPYYTMGLNEASNVEVKISFIASSDATNFAPFSVTADSLSVVDGKICMELPPDEGAFFYRFRIE
jgi:hypothetical protein